MTYKRFARAHRKPKESRDYDEAVPAGFHARKRFAKDGADRRHLAKDNAPRPPLATLLGQSEHQMTS
jgi:hypothetical protein